MERKVKLVSLPLLTLSYKYVDLFDKYNLRSQNISRGETMIALLISFIHVFHVFHLPCPYSTNSFEPKSFPHDFE
jgi:hypothetical protein